MIPRLQLSEVLCRLGKYSEASLRTFQHLVGIAAIGVHENPCQPPREAVRPWQGGGRFRVASHFGWLMAVELTAVYREVPEGFIAFVEELPGANAQGATLEEARENLREAVVLVLESNRALAEEDLAGARVIRESLRLTA